MFYVLYAKKIPKLCKLTDSNDLWSCGDGSRTVGKSKNLDTKVTGFLLLHKSPPMSKFLSDIFEKCPKWCVCEGSLTVCETILNFVSQSGVVW